MFISLDPSSTAIGYAAFRSLKCVKATIIKPRRQKDPALDRIDWMVKILSQEIDTVYHMLRRRKPREELVVVVEVTSGKVNRNRHGGGGAGLAIYGDAVGSIRTACRLNPQVDRVVQIFENEWIGGHGKAKRRRVAKANYGLYDASEDRGADLADAIALGVWWKEFGKVQDV